RVRTWSGGRSGASTISWDLRDSAGKAVAPGLYRLRVERSTGARDDLWTEVLSTASSPASTCGYTRLWGADRYVTAAQLGRAAYPTGREVVIVNGQQDSIVDGLVVAPLAV